MQLYTLRLLLLLNFGGFGSILLLSHFLAKGSAARLRLLGWVCVVFSVSVFAAPLSIMVSLYIYIYIDGKVLL